MIGIEQCCCGHPTCRDYWLTGIGKFCQGSGFTKDEADLIARLLNGESRLLVALKAAEAHLDYTGYGDSWERECAISSDIPGLIERTIAEAERKNL